MYYCFHVVHSALWSRMWSKLAPLKSTSGHRKIGQSIKTAVAAASRKPTEKKHNVVSPKAANRNMWSGRTTNPWSSHMVRSLWEQGSNLPSQGLFLLPPVSYCNLEKRVCQVLKITFSLPIILGAINKEKGARAIARVHTNALKKPVFYDIIIYRNRHIFLVSFSAF